MLVLRLSFRNTLSFLWLARDKAKWRGENMAPVTPERTCVKQQARTVSERSQNGIKQKANRDPEIRSQVIVEIALERWGSNSVSAHTLSRECTYYSV